jgi:hypothetical protein
VVAFRKKGKEKGACGLGQKAVMKSLWHQDHLKCVNEFGALKMNTQV